MEVAVPAWRNPTLRRRLLILALALVVIAGAGYGVLRGLGMAPGYGPLTDPGSQASDAGYPGGSGPVHVGVISANLLDIENHSHVSGILDSITLDRLTPGLELVGAYVVNRGLRCHLIFDGFVQDGVPIPRGARTLLLDSPSRRTAAHT